MEDAFTINGIGSHEPLPTITLREKIEAGDVPYKLGDGFFSILLTEYIRASSDTKQTSLAKGELHGYPVFMKAFFEDGIDVEGLEYEHCVYKHLYNNGVKDYRLVNIVPWVDSVTVTYEELLAVWRHHHNNSAFELFFQRLRLVMRETEARYIEKAMKYENKNKKVPKALESKCSLFKNRYALRIKILITELRRDVMTLDQYIKKHLVQTDPLIRRGMMAQIVVTLAQLNSMQVQHNDLHLDNILVQWKHPSERQSIYYSIGGKDIKIPIDTPKIWLYDFDLATCAACGANKRLSGGFCKMLNVCDKLNKRFDIYTVFGHLVRLAPWDEDMQKFIQRNWRRVYERFAHRMCSTKLLKEEDACDMKEDEPELVKIPKYVIEDEYFDPISF